MKNTLVPDFCIRHCQVPTSENVARDNENTGGRIDNRGLYFILSCSDEGLNARNRQLEFAFHGLVFNLSANAEQR